MRRFAIYSDIHGNSAALDAVFADIDARGLSERYCLGDLVGYGPDPGGVIARVRASGDGVVRGNYDEGVGRRAGGCGCYYPSAEAREDGEASFAWTDAALDDEEHAYLAGLPDEIRFETQGVRVLLVHGSPRKINEYLMEDRPEWQLARLAEEAEADLVCVGHVHVPYHRTVRLASGRIAHWVSAGSVGKPKDGDPRAGWVEVVLGTADEIEEHAPEDTQAENVGETCVGVRVHRVSYDAEAVAEAVVRAGLPASIAESLRSA